jgi:hypothetical protein
MKCLLESEPEVLKLGIGDRSRFMRKTAAEVEISGFLQTGRRTTSSSPVYVAQGLTGQAQKVSLAMVSALAASQSPSDGGGCRPST